MKQEEPPLLIKPLVILAVPENSHGWMSPDQAALFFGITTRELPKLIKIGLAPPAKISHKTYRYDLQNVLNVSKKLRESVNINYNN